MSALPNTLSDIISKVRRVTGRPSQAQISDVEIIKYVNTFYVYDMPEHLKLISLRYNYEFLTQANIPAYDFPTDVYITAMPPVFIAGYQTYMTQSRQNFFRINPQLNFEQNSVYTGNGTVGPYVGSFLNENSPSTPLTSSTSSQMFILPGFKANPPGAYSNSVTNPVPAKFLQWNVLITAQGAPNATSGIPTTVSLVDDGQGNLFDPSDPSTDVLVARGSINYTTGALEIFSSPSGFSSPIPAGNPINAQYIPYVPSRPNCAMFFQDQILLYPIPDQAYTVSFEVYKYPISFTVNPDGTFDGTLTPQLTEWWQLLAYGAADKIFADNADMESMAKFRPLLDEQMNLVLRRTIVQQTSERTATIYTEQQGPGQFPFGNNFSSF
jgi:hypothetical protein